MEFHIIDADGEYVHRLILPNIAALAMNIRLGERVVCAPPSAWSWWDGWQWVTKPERPSTAHTWDRAGKAWVDLRTEAQTTDEAAKSVRAQRNARLAACDWTQGRDIDVSVADTWAGYRQALRDISTQAGFPHAVVWPETPQ